MGIHEHEPSIQNSKETIVSVEEVTIASFFDGKLPSRSIHAKTTPTYDKLGNSTLLLLTTHNGSSENILYLVPPPLTGLETYDVLHFAAPSRVFGYDLGDINDWHTLYENPLNADRLKRHQTIPGWHIFERNREIVLNAIDNSNLGSKCKCNENEFDILDRCI